nr:hypothetical protein [Synergistaceae bacterium]
NTDSSVFLELSTQFYYTVLSGRWYRARQIEGEWKVEHVPNNELPTAFSEIKEGSAVGDVLSHVAGTEEAREAVLDNVEPGKGRRPPGPVSQDSLLGRRRLPGFAALFPARSAKPRFRYTLRFFLFPLNLILHWAANHPVLSHIDFCIAISCNYFSRFLRLRKIVGDMHLM